MYERSSAQPTQADINAYIAWLGTAGAWAKQHDGVGNPMRFRSVEGYVQNLGRSLRALHKQEHVITDSMQTHWALKATKRVLGDTQQRARPITLSELKTACTNVTGPKEFVLVFRLIALVAWFGAFRLGQLLPQISGQQAATMLLSDLEVSEDGRAVLVSSSRSKTNVFRAKTRNISISACESDSTLCLRTAFVAVREFRRLRGLPLDVPLCSLHSKVATFDDFVHSVQQLIAPRLPTAFEKGVVTGHSFRRGFTKAALLAGFSIEQIMLHGDWSHPESVVNSYGAGAVLPSIPMARHAVILLSGAGSFVSPATILSGHTAPVAVALSLATSAECQMNWLHQPGNPFAPMEATVDNGPDPVRLAKRARQWEFDMGNLSANNPYRPSGLAQTAGDDKLTTWLNKRARVWELENNKELTDDFSRAGFQGTTDVRQPRATRIE